MKRGDAAFAIGADAQCLPGAAAMADRAVHLGTGQRELDRPVEHARGEDGEDLRAVEDRLGAKAAAEERRADDDVFRRNAEISGVGRATHRQRLAGHVERDVIAVPSGDDGVRLHGIVVLRRRDIVGLHDVGGVRQPRLDITESGPWRRADAHTLRRVALAILETGQGRLSFILRVEERCSFRRRLQRLADHQRDRLVDVADRVVLQHLDAKAEGRHLLVRIMRQRRTVRRRDDLDHAGMGLGGRDIQRGDAAPCDTASDRHRVEKAFRIVVGRIGCAAGDLENAIAPRQWLAGA